MDRATRARIAAYTRWAHEPDRKAAVAPMHAGRDRRFERQVDPEGVLPPDERAKRVRAAKAAHYRRIGAMGNEAKRRRVERTAE